MREGAGAGLDRLRKSWAAQSVPARWVQVVVASLLLVGVPASLALQPHAVSTRHATVPPPASETPAPTPSALPTPVSQAAPVGPDGNSVVPLGGTRGGVGLLLSHPACPAIGAAPALRASYFPRLVIPRVGMNVEIHEGDGKAPPDGVWVGWHLPGSAGAGSHGNSVLYGHAHGSPPNSASGLFWPLHYMRDCDAVFYYTSPTAALRYQAVKVSTHWPARDASPYYPTPDERLTMQTCNGWGDNDPKTIVVAESLDPHAAAAPPAAAAGGGGEPAADPTPTPTRGPLPIGLPPHP